MAASWLRPTLLLLLLCSLSTNAGKSSSSSVAPTAAASGSSEVAARAAPESSSAKESKADEKEDQPEFRSAASAAATDDGASATTAGGKDGKAVSSAGTGSDGRGVANAEGTSGNGGGGGGSSSGAAPKERVIGVPLPAYASPFYNFGGIPPYPQAYPQPYPYGFGGFGYRYPGLYSPNPRFAVIPPNPVFRDDNAVATRIDDDETSDKSKETSPVLVKFLPVMPVPPIGYPPFPVNPYQVPVDPYVGLNQFGVNPYLGPFRGSPYRSLKIRPNVNPFSIRNLPYKQAPPRYAPHPVNHYANRVHKPNFGFY